MQPCRWKRREHILKGVIIHSFFDSRLQQKLNDFLALIPDDKLFDIKILGRSTLLILYKAWPRMKPILDKKALDAIRHAAARRLAQLADVTSCTSCPVCEYMNTQPVDCNDCDACPCPLGIIHKDALGYGCKDYCNDIRFVRERLRAVIKKCAKLEAQQKDAQTWPSQTSS